ncbi:MlaD family protein [Nocardia sp. NPDC004068]|uniref:MlaD family protein n=1 Tax=Nocardia sp. NPDC004068 TaxID=3364303 RepID=UPI0036BFC228
MISRIDSGRGPDEWGLRIRGIAVLVALAVVTGVAWRSAQPNRNGHTDFGLTVTALGDGVGPGTGVRLRGLTIGSVVDVRPQGPDRQLLTVSVGDAPLRELSTAMRARFVSANVFGTTALELIPAQGGSPIAPGSVLDMADAVGNYTVTQILRDSGRAILDVVTTQLTVSVDGAAALTSRTAPMLAAGLLTLRTLQRNQNMPMRDLLPKVADLTEGVAAFTPSALGILDALASVPELDDNGQVGLAHDTIVEVSNLVFSFAGKFVGALGPFSESFDVLLDLLVPTNQGLRDVTPDQVRRLLAGADGALHRDGDRVALDTEIILQGFPAFAMPLRTAGEAPR